MSWPVLGARAEIGFRALSDCLKCAQMHLLVRVDKPFKTEGQHWRDVCGREDRSGDDSCKAAEPQACNRMLGGLRSGFNLNASGVSDQPMKNPW